ncbi:cystatin-B-like [Babylonia areolata]|uniref:cystatin-B-like n=1 Tax=Babylonia areolata TaxID=304850 RepID=UPI003FD5F99C
MTGSAVSLTIHTKTTSTKKLQKEPDATQIFVKMKCGGLADTRDATEEIIAYCEEVKEKVKEKCDKELGKYRPVSYKSQVVAGTNFFVKIEIAEGGECIHVRLFRPLPHTQDPLELVDIQTGKTLVDAIEHF